MRVLITGGAGALGSALGAYLNQQGYLVTLLDNRGVTPSCSCRVSLVDIRDFSSLTEAIQNQDVVVHAAALHGVHVGKFTEAEFLSVNVTGTLNVLQAAYEANVKRVIFTSSASVYGVKRGIPRKDAVYVNEDTPICPIDLNDICKAQAEYWCTYFRYRYNLASVILRIGRFSCEDAMTFHESMLSGGIALDDVVHAVKLSIDAKDLKHSVFCIASKTRFTHADVARLAQSADAVIAERYPEAPAVYADLGLSLPKTLDRIVDTRRAEEHLGFRPQWSFDRFLREGLAQ
jgi:UDP-glucose 4-epimerase